MAAPETERPRLARLKKRRDFLRAARSGRSAAMPGLVLQATPRIDEDSPQAIGIGFTASRKVGNAVGRNRAKRRLRAAVDAVMAEKGRAGTDYVLIARQGTADRPFERLLGDLASLIERVEHPSPRSQARRRR